MRLIDCVGSGRERGRSHGESARQPVRDAIARWEEATLSGRPDTNIRDYCARFLSSTGLIAEVSRKTPDILEEIRGIADGAAKPFELVAAYNLMDEQWWYDLDDPKAEPGCSVLALRSGRETVLAQNMDLPGFMDGSQIVLRISAPNQPEALVLSSAGLIGLTGANRAGVGICVNTLLMLRHNPCGLPVSVVLRYALAQQTGSEALAAIRSCDHASGQHYAIADREGVVGLECSAGGCTVNCALGHPNLIHTNHPVASADIEGVVMDLLDARGRIADSRRRLVFLNERLGSLQGPEDVVALLADPSTSICKIATTSQSSQTFGSVVFRLGEKVAARFCPGRPGRAEWREIPFRE